jgi:hypothetical protein
MKCNPSSFPGECDLENLRTLCVPCHAKVTSEQTKRRASDARKAKDHDLKQKKLSFVPRGKKGAKVEKRPREFIDLESEEVGCENLNLVIRFLLYLVSRFCVDHLPSFLGLGFG